MNLRSVLIALSYAFGFLLGGTIRAADVPPPPPEVPIARPVVREVTDHQDFPGRVEAPQRVDLRARVTGYLLKTSFKEGGDVKQGDLLFEIDPRPYRAELDRADADLHRAEADLKLAETTLKRLRVTAQSAPKAISAEEMERAVAEVEKAKASIAVAKVNHEAAKLNIDFTRVVAPIDGRIGRRHLDPGNLVTADETTLATIVSRDPMHVYFDIDERTILRWRRAVREQKVEERKLPVAIGLTGEKDFPHQAVVDFVNNEIDTDTGTLRLRAVLDNKDGLLLPGLFVHVRLTLGQPYKALLVPATAVLVEDDWRFVYVVDDKDVIVKRPVVIEGERDGRRIVTKGLKADERVVIGRTQKVKPGMKVRPVEDENSPASPSAPGKSGVDARPVRGEPGPVLLVETAYPGANAAVLADTVAAPIEQQVRGMEKLQFLRSQCTEDGKYTLALTFARGVDLKMAQVLAQNRVALAMPTLPEAVRRREVRVLRSGADVCLIACLYSPENRFDTLYLSNYATIQIKDELSRLPGVAEVALVGQQEYGLRIHVDPHRLTAFNLSAADVTRAIEKQKIGGEIKIDAVENMSLKTDDAGRSIYLRDVARIELGSGSQSGQTFLDARQVVTLVVRPAWGADAHKVATALRERLSELRSRFPEGVDLTIPFDATAKNSTAAGFLLLDLDLPIGASPERVVAILRRCQKLLRQEQSVRDVLALTENPFDRFGKGPCILLRLTAAPNEKMVHTIRSRLLDEIKEMTLRVRAVSPALLPRWNYPVNLAISGPDADKVRKLASKLAEHLEQSKKLTDVWPNADATPRLQLRLTIDRQKAADLGLTLNDINTTLQVYHGGLYVNDFERFGRTWQVTIQSDIGSGEKARELGDVKVRNKHGEMVALSTVASVREVEGPRTRDFLDSRPMVEITANLPSGVTADQARKLCATLAEAARKELGLSAEYGLHWLLAPPTK